MHAPVEDVDDDGGRAVRKLQHLAQRKLEGGSEYIVAALVARACCGNCVDNHKVRERLDLGL